MELEMKNVKIEAKNFSGLRRLETVEENTSKLEN